MELKKNIFILLMLLPTLTFAQDTTSKLKFGINFSRVADGFIYHYPNLTLTIDERSKIFMGPQISPIRQMRDIWGIRAGYQYYLSLKKRKIGNLFAEYNIGYVPYIGGAGSPVSINYKPKYPGDITAIWEYRELTNTLGIGNTIIIFKSFYFNVALGYTLHWIHKTVIDDNSKSTEIYHFVFAKIGIGYDFLKF